MCCLPLLLLFLSLGTFHNFCTRQFNLFLTIVCLNMFCLKHISRNALKHPSGLLKRLLVIVYLKLCFPSQISRNAPKRPSDVTKMLLALSYKDLSIVLVVKVLLETELTVKVGNAQIVIKNRQKNATLLVFLFCNCPLYCENGENGFPALVYVWKNETLMQ